MKNRFFYQGQSVAEQDIEQHESAQNQLGFKDYTPQNLEIRPFTVKAHAYELEALDFIASKVGDNRSNFVKDLFLDSMVKAAADYVSGYDSVFATQKPLVESLSAYLDLDSSDLSPAAKNLLLTQIEEVAKNA